MKTHYLKTWSKYFKPVVSGEKTFEIRINDRNYQIGDILVLQEYDFDTQTYTGDAFRVIVAYIFYGGRFGIDDSMVVMAIKPINHCRALVFLA